MVVVRTEVQEQMLKAAREELLSGEYDILAGITIAKVAARAGIAERTAKRAFKAGELRRQLMEDLLRIKKGQDIDAATIVDIAGQLVTGARPLAEELGDVANFVFEHTSENDTFRAEAAFFGLGGEDLEVTTRLVSMYEMNIRRGRDALNAALAQRSDTSEVRKDWMSSEDFVRVLIALAEGLALQQAHRVSSVAAEIPLSLDIPEMHPELIKRVIGVVFESMCEVAGAGVEPS